MQCAIPYEQVVDGGEQSRCGTRPVHADGRRRHHCVVLGRVAFAHRRLRRVHHEAGVSHAEWLQQATADVLMPWHASHRFDDRTQQDVVGIAVGETLARSEVGRRVAEGCNHLPGRRLAPYRAGQHVG